MSNNADIRFIASFVDKVSKGARGAGKSLDDLETAAEGANDGLGGAEQTTESFGIELGGLFKTLAVVAAGVVAVGVAAKKAFDLAEEGAQIAQTAESFDLLLEKVGAAPDLLDQLRTASKGTISDFQLMTSTATLLAGATGEVATKLANATPRLLEIAKAANKLSPALGSVDFLYRSISVGVKRAQPLILDNLGLTLKVGEANTAYAESLGKTVPQLSAQERTIAILNATLEAGDALINQVGGSTESAADSYARLTTSLVNAKNAWLVTADVVVGPVVEAWNANFEAIGLLDKSLALNLITQAEYNRAQKLMAQHALSASEVIEEQTALHIEGIPIVAEAAALSERMARAQLGIANAALGVPAALEGVAGSLSDLNDALLPTTASLLDGTLAAEQLAIAYKNLGLSASMAASRTLVAAIASGELKEAQYEAAITALDQLKAMEALTAATLAGTIGEEAFFAITADGVVTMDEVNAALGFTTETIGATEEALMGGNEELTIFNEKLTAAEEKAIAAESKIDAANDAINALDGSTAEIEIILTGDEIPAIITKTKVGKGLKGKKKGGQSGGTFVVPPTAPNDSASVRISSGERVNVTNRSNTFDQSTRGSLGDRNQMQELANLIAGAIRVGGMA